MPMDRLHDICSRLERVCCVAHPVWYPAQAGQTRDSAVRWAGYGLDAF